MEAENHVPETPYSEEAANVVRKHSDDASTILNAERKVPENIVGTIEDGAASIKSQTVRISDINSIDASPSESPAAIQTASRTASIKPSSASLPSPGDNQTNASSLSRSTTTRTTHSSLLSGADGSVSQTSRSETGSNLTSNNGGDGSTSKRSSAYTSSYTDGTGSESAAMSQTSSSSPHSQVKAATSTGGASSIYSSEKPPSINIPVFEGSPELSQLATFYYTLDTKYYHSGYVYKLNALGVDGTPMFKDASPQVIAENGGYWSKWWMELVGPMLHLWRVPDEVASFGYTASLPFEQLVKNELDPPIEVMDTIKTFQEAPLQINFADSVVEVFPADFNAPSLPGNPAPPIPYNNFFSLTTASSNLFLFSSASVIQMNYWVCSIRLAMFELQRLNQLFTHRILHQADRLPVWNQFGLKPFSSGEYRGEILYEGPLQVRLPYSTIWKQVYAVVTSKYGPEAFAIAKTTSKLFSKKEAPKEFDPSKRGTIMIYDTKKAAQKGKLPLVTLNDVRSVYAIWPSNSQESQVRNVSLAKVECSFHLAEPPLNNFDTDRTFANFYDGMPQIRKIEDIEKLISGADPRPEPTDLLILTSNTQSLTQWIVSIMSAFSLDSESPLLEDEAKQMSIMQENVEGADDVAKWPSQLYLSLDEVGGVTMPRFSLEESKILFSHYLLQKVMYSRNGTLKAWSQNISKGEWERGLCDRKEMEWKLTVLFNWVEKVVSDLKENSIIVSKPHPTILVSAMATVMGWLGPVLTSMVGSASNITPQSANPPSLAESGKEAPSIGSKSTETKSFVSESSDGDGSISEEERSSEGSLSDDEELIEKESDEGSSSYNDSPQSTSKSSASQALTNSTQSKANDEESISPSESEEEFKFYEPNSLLSKVNSSKLPAKGQGPYFDTTGELNHRQAMLAASQYQKKETGSGPLLGIVQDPANKPKLQTGLLGEIERREEETKQLGFRASILPTNRMSIGTFQEPDTAFLQLNTIAQKMMETLKNPGQGVLESLKEDLLQMQSLISIGLQRKRSTMLAPNNAANPFAMPNITWSRSNSSKPTSSNNSPTNNKKKSFEFDSSSSSSPSSATSADTGSVKDTSGTDSDTSPSSSEFEDSGDAIGEDVPLGEVSKRLSAMPSSSLKPSLKPSLKFSNATMPTVTIDSPVSDASSESNDRPLSTLMHSKRPVSFHPPKPLLHNQFPPQMYQMQPSRPLSNISMKSVPPPQQAVKESHNRVLLPRDNRKEIRAAPLAKKSTPVTSTGDSSEGSVSDESD